MHQLVGWDVLKEWRVVMESKSHPKRAARVPAYPGLAQSLRKAEASSRAEGVDPNASPTYLYIKGLLLAGEITLDAAHEYLEDYFNTDDVVAQILLLLPKDDVWRASDYDDEPRSKGNFGLGPTLTMEPVTKSSEALQSLPEHRGCATEW